jgi:hypothetical protein
MKSDILLNNKPIEDLNEKNDFFWNIRKSKIYNIFYH